VAAVIGAGLKILAHVIGTEEHRSTAGAVHEGRFHRRA
jgi:hypothetical protein